MAKRRKNKKNTKASAASAASAVPIEKASSKNEKAKVEVDYEPDSEEDNDYTNNNFDDDFSSSSSSDDDGQVVLEGAMKQNSDDDDDLSSEEEDDDDDDNDDNDDNENDKGSEPPTKKSKTESTKRPSSKKDKPTPKNQTSTSKNTKNENIVNVEFLFRDMDESFFHGLKTLLTASNPLHAKHSSELSDLMIENISVGTIVSNEDECVFGFASVLSLSMSEITSKPCIQYLCQTSLKHCPVAHKEELSVVLSGKTKRPAGFLIHGRMINLPLEITMVLHEQLVLDMDWAVDNAEGGEDERKALDFGAFVVFAPCVDQKQEGGGASSIIYKNFEDEVFASHAEFVFSFDTPKSFATEEKQICTVIVMTKTGHRDAMKELKQMIGN